MFLLLYRDWLMSSRRHFHSCAMASDKTAQADPRLKKLKIQTGVVKRLTKDKSAYEKEISQTQQKMEKMVKEGMSHFLINKQEEVLRESQVMIPEVLGKLRTACAELETLMQEGAGDLAETEEYSTAQTVLEAGKEVLGQSSSQQT